MYLYVEIVIVSERPKCTITGVRVYKKSKKAKRETNNNLDSDSTTKPQKN